MPSVSALAGTNGQAVGLSEQDQVAVIGARPAAFRSAALVAANLTSPDSASTGSASDQGSLDTYL